MIRTHVLLAVLRRNFVSYFSSPTGYVFITVFVVLSSATAFWPDTFFVNNLANLDTLNRYFAYLLLFFVPAVAMGTWAEERKQGTDELLMTLPATDVELLLGKYLAALGIYSVSLLFSITHVIVLACLGEPDVGVMMGTYLGYWFLGAALLAAAMSVSLLTTSMTVAFILGACICAVPVFLGDATGIVWNWVGGLGVKEAFQDLSSGVLSLGAVLYFAGFAVLFLYLNLVFLARRHIRQATAWLHLGGRLASVLVIGVCLGILGGRLGWRMDLTSEGLHSLTLATRAVIDRVERPVYVHAFVSPEVPSGYVQTRENLLALLREYDAMGGDKIQVRYVETKRYSEEAREAEENYGIRPQAIFGMEEGRNRRDTSTFLGVAFVSGTEQGVIPFMHRGLSVEYELTRSLGVVSGEKRKKVGVATTDAKLFGGMNFQTFQSSPKWSIVTELEKQYEVKQISLDSPVTEKLDTLLVAMPSSLTQPQMDTLMAYIREGGPTLLFDDPLPMFNPGLAPDRPKQSPGGGRSPFMSAPPMPSQPKGNIRTLMDTIGVSWIKEMVVWDTFNPHPVYGGLPKEFVFVGPGGGNPEAFNPKEAVSSGLQEMLLLWSGELNRGAAPGLTFTPLLKSTGQAGGLLSRELFRPSFMGRGMQPNPNPPYRQSGEKILAARIQGKLAKAPAMPPGHPPVPGRKDDGEKGPHGPGAPEEAEINVIVVADLDCISENFFRMREDRPEGINFDNVTFVLNCVDVLAGDESYVALRKRRPKHRTLTTLEGLTKKFNDKLQEETEDAKDKADKALKKAQDDLNDKVKQIREDGEKSGADRGTIQRRVKLVEEVENRKLEIKRKQLDDERDAAIERATGDKERSVQAIERRIKWMAVLLPPILPFAIAIFVWIWRLSREGRTV